MQSSQIRRMSRAGVLVVATMMSLSGCRPAAELQDTGFTGKLVFQTQVQNLELRSGSHIEGKSPEDLIGAELPGRMFDLPRSTEETTKASADRSSPFSAAISDYSAFRAGDGDWILENYSDDNRNEVLGLLASDGARKQTFLIFTYLKSFEIWGEAEWQGFRLVLARYNGEKRGGVVLTFRETPDGWKRTNALREDETFDVIMSAFRVGEVTAKN